MSCETSMVQKGQSDPNCKSFFYGKYISGRAVLVGALVGIGLSFLLNVFSVAIGLSLVTTTKAGLISLAIGGFIGLLIGVIATMFVAGYTAGYLGRPYCEKRNLGALYGFTTWSVSLILMVLLAMPMSRFVSSYAAAVSNSAVVIMNDQTPSKTISTSTTPGGTSIAVSADSEKAVNTVGNATLLIFVLFFVGAVSCCFGGHCGMCHVGCGNCCSEKKE